MGTTVKLFSVILLLGLLGCDENNVNGPLDALDCAAYYESEIMGATSLEIYGKWNLVDISGGFSGSGYEPDFDFLEFKKFGIYGLVRNDTLFEYGKVALETFDPNQPEALQIRLIPEWYAGTNPYMQPEKYVVLNGLDSLALLSPCCDMYNYHFRKINQ